MTTIYSIAAAALEDPAVVASGISLFDIDDAQVAADILAEVDFSAAIQPTRVAVRLAPDQSAEDLAAYISRIELVVLEFPSFTDGRAFSQARMLRKRYRFAGHLRASGEVVQDQLAFMLTCGFDQFELPDGHEPPDFAAALADAWRFGNLVAGTALSTTPLYRRTGS